MRPEPDAHLDHLAHAVIGAAIEVHRTLGPGLLEELYESALSIELEWRGISHERQVPVPLLYRDQPIGDARLDLLIDKQLVVELKSVRALDDAHLGQMLGYLRAGRFPLGLLINFNVPRLRDGVRRVVETHSPPKPGPSRSRHTPAPPSPK